MTRVSQPTMFGLPVRPATARELAEQNQNLLICMSVLIQRLGDRAEISDEDVAHELSNPSTLVFDRIEQAMKITRQCGKSNSTASSGH